MATTDPVIQGIFPPIPTPFMENGALDLEKLQYNVTRWNAAPLAGYVTMGSNGECAYLSADEKIALVQAVRAAAPPNRLVIAGSGMESTQATMRLTMRVAEAGADLALVITPNYYRNQMGSQALADHYRTLADASPIPILLYNVPAYTGLDMPNGLILELAQHSNIVGLKESSGDMVKAKEIIDRSPPGFRFLVGTANHYLDALTLGADGGIMALANIAAHSLQEITEAFKGGDLELAAQIQQRLIPANKAVTSHFGVPGLKAALDLLGGYGGPPRRPLLALDEEDRNTLRGTLTTAGFL